MKQKIQLFTFFALLCTIVLISGVSVRAERSVKMIPSPVLFQTVIPDENFRKFINESVLTQDLNDTEVFSEAHREELQSFSGILDLSKQKIADLTGVSYFKNITGLIAEGNRIQVLNLDGMQHLESIRVARNQLTKVTLTNLPALKDVDVSYNALSEFNIQALTSLESLNCASNELTALDVSKNVNLDTLIVENNQLAELDISKLSGLMTFIGGGNQLLSFDISALPNKDKFDLFELRRSFVTMEAKAVGFQYGITLPESAIGPAGNKFSGGGVYLTGTRSLVWSNLMDIPTSCTYQYKIKGSEEVVNVTIYIDKTALFKEVLTVGTPVNFTTANSACDKITLSWEVVNGAGGYRIYRSTSEKGTYRLIKTITSGMKTSYVNSKLVTGTTYFYKIRAFRSIGTSKYFGSYSSVISKKAVPQKPVISLSKYSASKIKITWKKISGISGYYIYRSTSINGTYKKIKHITSKTATSFINTKRSKGVKYYYRMRAYCKVNGKVIYGAYSAKKSKKI